MPQILDVYAKITDGITYKPYLTKKLKTYDINDLENAINNNATFLIRKDNDVIFALSRWVSAKRTRTYPYARVYDTLDFHGKQVAIIPVLKDEGVGDGGCQDFIQWDTLSLMSLLGVFVIISYYIDAEKHKKKENRITNLKYDISHIREQLNKLYDYHTDALHWNLGQAKSVSEICEKAITAYQKISKKLGVDMHSKNGIHKKLLKIKEDENHFMESSRSLSQLAQHRESITIQPKEKLSGIKGRITITNFLGGNYYFTSDEIEITNNILYLIEDKHTSFKKSPSLDDIKDGLLKMILFSHLKEAFVDNKKYKVIAQLNLTTNHSIDEKLLTIKHKELIKKLKEEAKQNNFQIKINNHLLDT